MTMNHTARSLALGAAAILLLSGAMAQDAHAINAENTPSNVAPEGFFVEPEALFMQFSDSNTDYAWRSADSVDKTVSTVEDIGSDYEFGWRFGIGYRWANRWAIDARWTSVDDNQKDAATAGSTWIGSTIATDDWWYGDIAAVTGRVDRDLDIIDVEVSRTWGDMDGHHMKLFFGPRYLTYDNSLETVSYDTDADAVAWGMRDSNVDAWGVRVGIEGHVALGHETGWSFFGYAAASSLVANVDSSYMATYYDKFADETFVDEGHDSDDRTSNGLEAGLGFQWAHDFDNWNFTIRFGWEVSNYTDLTDSASSWSGAPSTDDLGLDGGFVRFGFTF